jgi:hypothetical protein
MRSPLWKNAIVGSVIFVISLFWMSGCAGFAKPEQFKPVVIKNAAVGLNFGADGAISFVDQEGQLVKPRPFADLVNRCRDGKMCEIEKVQTMTVYHVTGSHYIWIDIDGESICLKYSDTWHYQGPCW